MTVKGVTSCHDRFYACLRDSSVGFVKDDWLKSFLFLCSVWDTVSDQVQHLSFFLSDINFLFKFLASVLVNVQMISIIFGLDHRQGFDVDVFRLPPLIRRCCFFVLASFCECVGYVGGVFVVRERDVFGDRSVYVGLGWSSIVVNVVREVFLFRLRFETTKEDSVLTAFPSGFSNFIFGRAWVKWRLADRLFVWPTMS